MDNNTPLPLRARLLIIGVVMGGVAAIAVRIGELALWEVGDLLAFFVLFVGITITEQFPIPLRFQSETLSFSLTETM